MQSVEIARVSSDRPAQQQQQQQTNNALMKSPPKLLVKTQSDVSVHRASADLLASSMTSTSTVGVDFADPELQQNVRVSSFVCLSVVMIFRKNLGEEATVSCSELAFR
jgi:hypothetical protein